jgi:hypothetical protein
MTKERSDHRRQFVDTEQGAQSQPLHLILALDELAPDASLDMRPDLLVGVSRSEYGGRKNSCSWPAWL